MEVLNYREQAASGSIVAIFDLVIPALGMTFRNWKLLRGKNGRCFPASPSYSYQDEAGEKKWGALIEINEKRRSDFHRAVMEALKPYLKETDFWESSVPG